MVLCKSVRDRLDSATGRLETLTYCLGAAFIALAACSADTSNPGCVAARAYLACRASNGAGETCLSPESTTALPACTSLNPDDVSQCPSGGFSMSECTDQCKDDEYAVTCSGQPPSASCRSLPPNPGGFAEPYCCPCGS